MLSGHFFKRCCNAMRCRYHVVILAFLWTCGLICGIHFAANDDTFSLLMRTVLSSGVSIVGLVTVILLPLLLSFLSVYYSVPYMIYLICFLRALSCGYLLCGIAVVFADAAWLVRILLLFSDSSVAILLHWFWIRHLKEGRFKLRQDMCLCCTLAAIIGMLDYSLVSPFGQMLMDHL